MMKSVFTLLFCMFVYSEGGEYYYFGCFRDVSGQRVMSDPMHSSWSNSLTYCNSYCVERKNLYFGVESGEECWCHNDHRDFSKHGASEDCTDPCPGDNSVMCGGHYAIDIYRTSFRPANDYIGCFVDDMDRIMGSRLDSNENTPAFCNQYCEGLSMLYYGVSSGRECYCGNDPTDIARYGPAGNCNMACAGDQNLICGGTWAMAVFRTGLTPAHKFIGCFRDTPYDRIMENKKSFENNNQETCSNWCEASGYTYFGLQATKECYCSQDIQKIIKYGLTTRCNEDCPGNINFKCGGAYSMAVFTVAKDG